MPDRILVINPNSTDAVTRAIDDALRPLRIAGGPGIDCMTLREGPPGVESQSDADAVIAPLCRAIRDAEPETAAFVIACFSDPSLLSAREATNTAPTCWSWAAPAWPATAPVSKRPSRSPVVEPTQAAVAMAIGRIRLGW